MYLRKTSRTNKDGSKITYLQLAHNYWDSESGFSKTQVIYSFGREDELDREVLERLVDSIRRYLNPEEAQFSKPEIERATEFAFVSAKRFGGAWTLDQLWRKFGFDSIIARLLKGRNYEIDIERLIFTMVANRALDPSSKLGIEQWVEDDVYIPGVESISVHNLYRSMDFLLDVKDELEEQVFNSVANLLNLEVDLLYFDTTSTYFEVQPDEVDEDDDFRKIGYSKDKRPDLVQMVVGLAVTRDGIPIKSWVWPGNTADMSVVQEVKNDLTGWKLGRVISVMDRGFASDENARYLQRAGGHYILGEKLRSSKEEVKEAMARPGRYQKIRENLEIKEVIVGDGEARKRYVLAYNASEAKRQKAQRDQIVAEIESRLNSLKQLPAKEHTKTMCTLRAHKTYGRYIKQLQDGRLKIDKSKINEDEKFDGKYLMITSDDTLSAEDVALGYKQLVDVEDAFRTLKTELKLRPVYHRLEDRIKAHVFISWLALLLVRVAENATQMTWRNLRHELETMKVGRFIFNSGEVYQCTELTPEQAGMLRAMGIEKPSKYLKIAPKS